MDTINRIAEQLDLCIKREEILDYCLESGEFREIVEGTKLILKTAPIKGEGNGSATSSTPS